LIKGAAEEFMKLGNEEQASVCRRITEEEFPLKNYSGYVLTKY